MMEDTASSIAHTHYNDMTQPLLIAFSVLLLLQGTLTTWVSAEPSLYKAVQQLPYLKQQRYSGHRLDNLQRCAVCYRQREAIKLYSFQGMMVLAVDAVKA
jgi:hypothetical protein